MKIEDIVITILLGLASVFAVVALLVLIAGAFRVLLYVLGVS
jgi:hypothetical protein